MQAQDYWHLLQYNEGLLTSTTTQGGTTGIYYNMREHYWSNSWGYCKYWCYIELQNHLIFPWCFFSLYVLAREGNTLFHIPSITVSNKASVPKGSSWHEAQKIRQALNTLRQCWVNQAFADPCGKGREETIYFSFLTRHHPLALCSSLTKGASNTFTIDRFN